MQSIEAPDQTPTNQNKMASEDEIINIDDDSAEEEIDDEPEADIQLAMERIAQNPTPEELMQFRLDSLKEEGENENENRPEDERPSALYEHAYIKYYQPEPEERANDRLNDDRYKEGFYTLTTDKKTFKNHTIDNKAQNASGRLLCAPGAIS